MRPKSLPIRVPSFISDVYLNFNTVEYTGRDGRIFIPSHKVLQNMNLDEVEDLYYRYIENIQTVCPRLRHIGNDGDGGYLVCETTLNNHCLAYSFGDGQPDHEHSKLVEFHKLGLGGHDLINKAGWRLKTLGSIRKLLGHEERPLDILKIDVEGGEWSSLAQILHTNTLEKADIKLSIIEFHIVFTPQDLRAHLHGLHILQDTYKSGYRIYYFRIWAGAPCSIKNKKTKKVRATCHEVHFMKFGNQIF